MNVSQRIQTVSRLFLDTPPIVYYVEENALYLPRVVPVFDRIDAGELLAITSPITLSECLVAPFRANSIELVQEFQRLDCCQRQYAVPNDRRDDR